MVKLKLISDQALFEGEHNKKDGLGFSVYAKVLADAAYYTKGPFTIGVFGNWGTGKTSLLRMIEKELLDHDEIITVWFNAWKFEKEEHPIIPLIATITNTIEKDNNFKKFGKEFVKTLRSLAYGFSGKIKFGIPDIAGIETSFSAKDMIDREKELSTDRLLDNNLYYEAYDKLSNIKVKNSKIFVFIDDLDRCFPDNAIKLLESIKLVLNQEKFVFIIGVAREIIEGFLHHRYKIEYGLENFEEKSYFDKIIQLPFSIPPNEERIEEFYTNILELLYAEDRKILKEILPIIGFSCSYNPRTTIKFINNLLIDTAIYNSIRGPRVQKMPIGFFAVNRSLQYQWEDIFQLLRQSDYLCEQIYSWANTHFGEANKKDINNPGLITKIESDLKLKELFLSKPGLNWLKDPDKRQASVHFMLARRQVEKSDVDSSYYGDNVLLHSEYDNPTLRKIENQFVKEGLNYSSISNGDFFRPWTQGLSVSNWIIFLQSKYNSKNNFEGYYKYINSTCGPYRNIFVLIEKSENSVEFNQLMSDLGSYNIKYFIYPNELDQLCKEVQLNQKWDNFRNKLDTE